MYEYVAPSGPTSPYDLFSQLQMQMQQQQRQQHQQPQTLHQPQAQYLHQDMLQQRQQQLHSRLFNQKSPLDADNLASTLASTSLSKYSQARPQPSHKPPPMSATTSSGSTTTTTSSSSELSLPSTSASSISQSQSPIHAQQHPHHPHHPGPITIPPMAPVTFSMSPHTPHASGMSLSPLHHPSMGSPYHLYPSSSAAAHSAAYQQRQHQHHQHHPQVTPHGLPPITPSMPPFTFLPPPSHQQQRQQQQQQHNNTRIGIITLRLPRTFLVQAAALILPALVAFPRPPYRTLRLLQAQPSPGDAPSAPRRTCTSSSPSPPRTHDERAAAAVLAADAPPAEPRGRARPLLAGRRHVPRHVLRTTG
ncbi:hypothetical protein BDZ97DRAFT_296384 [Flammula alnicola]|nr:hypothetical protein BDZ97DRAFT_296384 [Flammula alnicola]